jgi:uncharacterized protein DUF6788
MSERRRQVAAVVKLTESMLRGTLTPLYRRCGTATCYCASGEQKHGPVYSLNWSEAGQPQRLYIPPELVEQVQEGVEAYRRYREVGLQLAEQNAEALGLRVKPRRRRR